MRRLILGFKQTYKCKKICILKQKNKRNFHLKRSNDF